MFDFEERIADLFTAHQIDFLFDENRHLLNSPRLHIRFVPVCGTGFLPPGNVPATGSPFTIRLWEDVYRQHPQVVASRVLAALGCTRRLHGRDTVVQAISQAALNDFLSVNHLNVPVRAKYRYALFRGRDMVAVAAFGRSCPVQHGGRTYRSHELIRFGSLLNHTVVGGLSKLIRHFERLVKPQHLMTSVDREWSAGKGYLRLGFEVAGISKPQTFWLDPQECRRFYPHRLPAGTNPDNLLARGWQKITNLGNIKLVKFV